MSNQKIFEGIGSVASELDSLGAKRILLCTGKRSYSNSSYKDEFEKSLSGFELIHFADIFPNPKVEELEVGISFARDANYDAVLAVGGGSVIDSAKIINFFACQDFTIRDYFVKKKSEPTKPKALIAIATTSGTGSESTQFATLYMDKIKNSLDHKFNLPSVVVIDPMFSVDLPNYVTAYTGVDALSQAIESYWNVNSTDHSKGLAKEAIKLINESLLATIENPKSKELRLSMAKGANLAGQAIQITKTTAPHAISYPMTSFFDIPHGEAVGMSLPHVLEYNYHVVDDASDSRGPEYVKKTIEEIVTLLGQSDVVEAKSYLIDLFQKVGLKTKLSLFNLKKSDLETIVENGFNPDRVKNNPRLLTRESLLGLLEQMY